MSALKRARKPSMHNLFLVLWHFPSKLPGAICQQNHNQRDRYTVFLGSFSVQLCLFYQALILLTMNMGVIFPFAVTKPVCFRTVIIPCLPTLLDFFPEGKKTQLAKLWRKHGKGSQKKSFR